MFIRKKRIKGREYFYLVKSIRKGKKVRQITLKYFGTEIPKNFDFKHLENKGVIKCKN
ncbi:MAG: hypothetical protein QW802_00390 [Candidatus Altiarchaeota archaeon]